MKEAPSIKAVVFDYGGVIELSSATASLFSDIADAIGVPVDTFRSEYYKLNHLSNVGNMPQEELLPRVASLMGIDSAKNIILSVMDAHRLQKTVNTELVDLLSIIRQQGFKVAIFSNNTSKLRDRLKENGILELVDEVVISGEIGFQKPHKDAFDFLFKVLGVLSHEVVFIDDSSKSIEGAGEIGYIPILFKNNEQLMAELQNIGISL
jgi:epoxide hydrolase-like predicted phosphatase